MTKPETMPQAVIDAVTQWAGSKERAAAFFTGMRWDSLDGCYYLQLFNMTVGIEIDGYIHS
jgi:hypothetical protein